MKNSRIGNLISDYDNIEFNNITKFELRIFSVNENNLIGNFKENINTLQIFINH